MVSLRRAYINDTVLCGDRGFVVWAQDRDDLGQCFLDLAFLLPAQVSSFRFVVPWQLNIFLDFVGSHLCLLFGFPSPPLLPENPATEIHPDQSEFGDPGDGLVAHHPGPVPLLHRPHLRHQSGGGGDPVRSCSDHSLVSTSDVHILDIPQAQSVHTWTKTNVGVLVSLSSCQYNTGGTFGNIFRDIHHHFILDS